MQVRARNVSEVRVSIDLSEEEARGVLTALSYFDTANGGNNFEMGYRGEPDALKEHRAARSLLKSLDKALTGARGGARVEGV